MKINMPKERINTPDMDLIYKDIRTFKVRALEELRRAKRYATFVSMLLIDLSHVDSDSEIENFGNFDDFILSVRKLVRNSIRESDLITTSSRHLILILLLDTPKEGASALSERLKKSLRYFMCNNIRSPLNWRVPTKEYYFPSDPGDSFSIQAFFDQIAES
jgi:GGDEF domain-containing protein